MTMVFERPAPSNDPTPVPAPAVAVTADVPVNIFGASNAAPTLANPTAADAAAPINIFGAPTAPVPTAVPTPAPATIALGTVFQATFAAGSLGLNLQKRANSEGGGRVVVTSSAGQSIAAGVQVGDELVAMYDAYRGWAEVSV
jgi:hypothetical protein